MRGWRGQSARRAVVLAAALTGLAAGSVEEAPRAHGDVRDAAVAVIGEPPLEVTIEVIGRDGAHGRPALEIAMELACPPPALLACRPRVTLRVDARSLATLLPDPARHGEAGC